MLAMIPTTQGPLRCVPETINHQAKRGKLANNALIQKLLDLIDETLEALPYDEKVAIAYMDEDRLEVLHEGLSRYILTQIDDDPEDLHNVISEIWQRLKKTHGLRVTE